MNQPFFTIWYADSRYGFTFWTGGGLAIMRSASPYVSKMNAKMAAKTVSQLFADFPAPPIRDAGSIERGKAEKRHAKQLGKQPARQP